MIKIYRKHGRKAFRSIAVHGGPGATGDLYDMCEGLASEEKGIAEMLHNGESIAEQVDEIFRAIQEECTGPVDLIGHSWGAWLVVFYAAEFPERVRRLILISSGAFEDKYLQQMNRTRESRFDEADFDKLREYFRLMNEAKGEEGNDYFRKAGALFHKTDSFDEEELNPAVKVNVSKEIYEKVWPEAAGKRTTGELLRALKDVKCPISVIHGDYDPHPFDGVKNPLLENNKEAEFYLLKDCGHNPWRERHAKREFYKIMEEILR
ncbi:MAG TPA: alpha/beta hydrolase [Thermotogota bacterium]|nr:alpha/beta hydrolase [Thermotogota bacterium]